MVESIYLQTSIVGTGDECITRSQTGTEDSEALAALLLEPVETTTNIDHALAAGIEGASNIRGNGIVAALEFRRPADVMVGLAQPQRGDPIPVHDRAQRVVAEGIGVPLRENDHRFFARPPLAVESGKPARVHRVIFRVRSAHR